MENESTLVMASKSSMGTVLNKLYFSNEFVVQVMVKILIVDHV